MKREAPLVPDVLPPARVVPAEPTPAQIFAAVLALAQGLEALRAEVRQLAANVPEVLVDLAEARKVLGVSERTLRRWGAEHKVACRRVGKTLRFPLAAPKPQKAA